MNAHNILWSSVEADAIAGGASTRPWLASGIAVNAGAVRRGDLYFATPDDDLVSVFAQGTAAAVIPYAMRAMDYNHRGVGPLLRVENVYDTLRLLARAARFRTRATVIGVQGPQMRAGVARTIATLAPVYTGMGHLSAAQAALPENANFAVFAMSPEAAPDIAIVHKDVRAAGTVFDAMKPSGRVMIFHPGPDGERDVQALAARARAAGIRNIFTFGRAVGCDARVFSIAPQREGVLTVMRILGEDFTLPMDSADAVMPALAAMLVMRLHDMPLAAEQAPPRAKAPGVAGSTYASLFLPRIRQPFEAAFRVANIVDLGGGRRTAVLEDIFSGDRGVRRIGTACPQDIPARLGDIDLVCTSRAPALYADASQAIACARPGGDLGHIATDVLSAGDFLALKNLRNGIKNLSAEALRLVPAQRPRLKA